MIDFPLNLDDEEESRAWYEGSLWLSLDRFERFWPVVGLALENGEAVKSAVRGVLRVKYAMDAANRAGWAADPDAPDVFDYDDEELAKTCFRSINETAGTQDAECIARWLAGPLLGAIKDPKWEEQPKWHYAWSGLFYHLGEEDPIMLASRYGIPADTASKLVEIAARFRSEDDAIHERVDAAEQEPLSGWDAIAYADYRWDDPSVNPLAGLWLHLRYICFDRAWAEVVRCTRPADMDALIQWGRAYAAAHMSSTIYDQEVNIPDDVRAAW